MTTKLDWENLQELRCPKCYSDMSRSGSVYNCDCGFKIGKTRLLELADEMIHTAKERQDFEDLLEADEI